jgi:DNA-3-methyladenine glycosylase II
VARTSHAAAARALAERDPAMARLVELAGLPKLRERHDTNFEALVRSIVFQQLAGAAASTIHGRFVALLDGQVEPATVLVQSDEALRSVGLSGNKAASIRDLATKVADGTVILDPRRLARETDEDVITRLSGVRGIGRWTAEMFLLFQLRRLDVWPTGDLGVRRGYGLAHGIPMPTPKELEQYGDAYRPYRSVAAWYCWRATEVYAGAKESAVTS